MSCLHVDGGWLIRVTLAEGWNGCANFLEIRHECNLLLELALLFIKYFFALGKVIWQYISSKYSVFEAFLVCKLLVIREVIDDDLTASSTANGMHVHCQAV